MADREWPTKTFYQACCLDCAREGNQYTRAQPRLREGSAQTDVRVHRERSRGIENPCDNLEIRKFEAEAHPGGTPVERPILEPLEEEVA